MMGLRNITRRMKGSVPSGVYCTLLNALILLLYVQLSSTEMHNSRQEIPSELPSLKNQQHINKNRVVSLDGCKKYLCKYGYLTVCNCKPHLVVKRQALEDFLPVEHITPDEQTPKPSTPAVDKRGDVPQTLCTDKDYSNAMEQFQSNYRLPVTGVCDIATKARMSERRCGQPDSVLDIDASGIKSVDNTDSATASSEAKTRTSRSVGSLSDLLQASAETDASVLRRRQMFEEYLKEVENDPIPVGAYKRHKRSVLNITINDDYPGLWAKRRITWRFMSDHFNPAMAISHQRAILKKAFRYWSEVSPLCFSEDNLSPQADIEIGFLAGIHLSCFRQFDGFGGEVAHKYYRDVHFDNEEPFTTEGMESVESVSLLVVAVHELGHVIGLNHSDLDKSVMNAIYHRQMRGKFELSDHDRQQVKKAYGPCNGSFDTTFDLVKWKYTPGTGEQKRIFNTFFFRSDHFWQYENQKNRTRYGDPQTIGPTWQGVPNHVDAFLHYFEVRFTSNGPDMYDEHYFFKGDRYYLYNAQDDKVDETGYIRTKFPSGSLGEPIPANLDTVFYDHRDKLTYFFKGEWVYTYQYKPDISHSCCVDKQKISDLFPPATPGDLVAPSGNTYARDLDSVYYSYHLKKAFFIKGNDLWLNVPFNLVSGAGNSMKYIGTWSENWHFICDGECS